MPDPRTQRPLAHEARCNYVGQTSRSSWPTSRVRRRGRRSSCRGRLRAAAGGRRRRGGGSRRGRRSCTPTSRATSRAHFVQVSAIRTAFAEAEVRHGDRLRVERSAGCRWRRAAASQMTTRDRRAHGLGLDAGAVYDPRRLGLAVPAPRGQGARRRARTRRRLRHEGDALPRGGPRPAGPRSSSSGR